MKITFLFFSAHGVCSPGLAGSPGSGSLTCQLPDGGWAGAVEGMGRNGGGGPAPASLTLPVLSGLLMWLSVGAGWPFHKAAHWTTEVLTGSPEQGCWRTM